MKLLLLCFVSLSLGTVSEAATWYGFCWAQKTSGVYCSSIDYSPSATAQYFACKQYAQGIGSTNFGSFRNTSKSALSLKQGEVCNYVGNLSKYECFIEERCESNGNVTSSISPINGAVFSVTGDSETARKSCVAQFSQKYLDALTALPSNCLMGAKAVMTLP